MGARAVTRQTCAGLAGLLLGLAACDGAGAPRGLEALGPDTTGNPVEAQAIQPAAIVQASAPQLQLPWPEELGGGTVVRGASAGAPITLSGYEYFAKADNATPDLPNQQLRLTAEPGVMSWGIYAFGGVAENDGPFGLRVELAGQLPGTYYVGIADYRRLAWQWTQLSAPTGDDYLSLPAAWQPVSPGGIAYAAVVAWDGDAAALASLTLHRNESAPPPVGLTASDGVSGSTINLNWTDPLVSFPGLDYDAISIERALDIGGPWSEIDQALPGTTEFDDVHDDDLNYIPYDTPVYYRLHTIAGGTPGAASAVDAGYRRLGNVSGLIASDGAYSDGVHLSWEETPGAEAYLLEYMSGAGSPPDWTALASVPAPQTTFLHNASWPIGQEAQEMEDYTYRAKAQLGSDTSADWSAEDSGYYMAAPLAQLTATPERGMAPLTVELDASASYDPGGGNIIKFQWDWDGDGSWDFDSGSDATVSHMFTRFGSLPTAVRVTDDELQTAVTQQTVEVPGWAHSWRRALTFNYTYGIARAPDGKLWVAGVATDSDDPTCVLLCYQPDGTLLLVRRWDATPLSGPVDIDCDANSNVYVLHWGTTWGAGSNDVLLLKYNSQGVLQWQKGWGTSGNDRGSALAVVGGGDSYVVGRVRSDSTDTYDVLVLKVDSSGELQWQKSYHQTNTSVEEALGAAINQNGLFVCGTLADSGIAPDTFVLQIASDGALGWQRLWHSTQGSSCSSIALADETVLLAGTINLGAPQLEDCLVLGWTSTGEPGYWKTFGSTDTEASNGLVIVGGETYVLAQVTHPGDSYLGFGFYHLDASGLAWQHACFGTTIVAANSLVAGSGGELYASGFSTNGRTLDWYDSALTMADAVGTFYDLALSSTDLSGSYGDLGGTDSSVTGSPDIDPSGDEMLVLRYDVQ
jgi:hypothetical protein